MSAIIETSAETDLVIMPKTYELGLHPNLPDDEYRRAPGLNKSHLDNIAISPALAMWRRLHPDPPTAAMALGSALHCLVLEPEKFAERFVPSIYDDYKTKEARDWRDLQTSLGRRVLRTKSDDPVRNPSEWDRVDRMARAVMAHPIAGVLFADEGPTELSMFWIDQFALHRRRPCKGRLDKWCAWHNVIADLKKVPIEGAAMSNFARKVHDYRYDSQAAMYTDGAIQCGLSVRAFVFVVVEEDPPYQVAAYTLPSEWIRIGRQKYIRDIDTASQCMEADEWPAYPPEIREILQPGYTKFSPVT